MSPLIAEMIIQTHERRVEQNLRAYRARTAARRGRPAPQRLVRRRFAHGLLWLAGHLDPSAVRGRRPAAPC